MAKKGARILSAAGEGTETDDPAAVFTRRILDAVSELERALIAARTALEDVSASSGSGAAMFAVASNGLLA